MDTEVKEQDLFMFSIFLCWLNILGGSNMLILPHKSPILCREHSSVNYLMSSLIPGTIYDAIWIELQGCVGKLYFYCIHDIIW